MTDGYPTESTPLIRNSSSGQNYVNPENSCKESITFYDHPSTSLASIRQPNGYYINQSTDR